MVSPELMNIDFKELLHPRIIKNCLKLFTDGYYQCSSLQAMTQVELALKEKSGVIKLYGVDLCKSLFGKKGQDIKRDRKGKDIKLRVPFGDEMQEKAEQLFSAAFSYYRNYAAHEAYDGSKIDRETCLRIMIIATELLNLINASELSFADAGGLQGLVKTGLFENEHSIIELLRFFINGYTIIDDVVDGFYEEMAHKGFDDVHLKAVYDVGLLEYIEERYIQSDDGLDDDNPPDTIGVFKLTHLGEKTVKGAAFYSKSN
jgi:uncharacterized protein (TIGR02391 family)